MFVRPTDITSVHDISVIIHLPESQVRELYDEFVEKWERTGGVDGVREQYMVSVMLANWIQDTGYPNVSLLLPHHSHVHEQKRLPSLHL